MIKFVALIALFALVQADRSAIVALSGSNGTVTGSVTFMQTSEGVKIEGSVTGLKKGKHGFHVHVSGDISDGCKGAKGHFNPHNKNHGAPSDEERHVGDLGNIVAEANTVAQISIFDKLISLEDGEHNIIGRAVVVHEDEDDLGKGGKKDSLTTGHAGNRVACGVIGILEEYTVASSRIIASSWILTTSAIFLTTFSFKLL